LKKVIKIDKRAIEELEDFSEKVKIKFRGLIDILMSEGRLEYPNGKKIGKNLFEIRIKVNGVYRGFYAYLVNDVILILHFFNKKTQKTPSKDILVSERRLREYE
jgi:phage-related protein